MGKFARQNTIFGASDEHSGDEKLQVTMEVLKESGLVGIEVIDVGYLVGSNWSSLSREDAALDIQVLTLIRETPCADRFRLLYLPSVLRRYTRLHRYRTSTRWRSSPWFSFWLTNHE